MNLAARVKESAITEFRDGRESLETAGARLRLAIPSRWPGGAACNRSKDFGKCDCFTIVDIEGGKIRGIETAPNPYHYEKIGFGTVDLLMLLGTDAVIVSDKKSIPLLNLRESGIKIYLGASTSVLGAVEDFIFETLVPV